jgi:ribosomal protein L33
MMIMTAKDFFKQFPDESACVHHMKKMREKNGLVCRKCASKRLSWLSTINRWECMDCRAKTTIRSGTIMMHSKLPLHTWYYCMFLMMTTTKAVSAKDMQQRLGMKRYEPVWYMMQKIRLAMGKANESVKLDGTVEFDDGFFRAEKKEKDLYQQLFNRGRETIFMVYLISLISKNVFQSDLIIPRQPSAYQLLEPNRQISFCLFYKSDS